jgi:hypothetical protein
VKQFTAFVFLSVLAVMLLMPTPAMADQKHFKIYPTANTNTWSNILAAETLTTITVPVASYSKLKLWAVVDSIATGATCTTRVVVQYRWRYSFPSDPATYYYGSWTKLSDSIVTAKALTGFTLFGTALAASDTLMWFNDVQVRGYGTAGNDSSKVRCYLEACGSR